MYPGLVSDPMVWTDRRFWIAFLQDLQECSLSSYLIFYAPCIIRVCLMYEHLQV